MGDASVELPGQMVTYAFEAAGNYTVTLHVEDDDGNVDSDEIRVAASTYSGTQAVVVTVWGNPYTYTQVVIVTESLTLRGGYTTADWTTSNPITNPTIIDAQRISSPELAASTAA